MTTKIMVVEDDALIMQLLRYQLGGAGYEVVCVSNGLRALERLLLEAPQLIILDVMMPELSGWDACRQIRACSSVPIMMLTAKGADNDVVMGLTSGADDYVTKPFTLPVLLARVEALLRRSAASKSAGTSSPRSGDTRVHRDDMASLAAEPMIKADPRVRTLVPSHGDLGGEYLIQGSHHIQQSSYPTVAVQEPTTEHSHQPAPLASTSPGRIGYQLRQARIAKGAALLEVAQECEVRWEFLQALEQENFAYIPRVELRRALRTYSAYLGLDVYALTGRPSPPARTLPVLPPVALAMLVVVIVVIISVSVVLL